MTIIMSMNRSPMSTLTFRTIITPMNTAGRMVRTPIGIYMSRSVIRMPTSPISIIDTNIENDILESCSTLHCCVFTHFRIR